MTDRQTMRIVIDVKLPMGDIDEIEDELDVILADTILEYGGEVLDIKEYESLESR